MKNRIFIIFVISVAIICVFLGFWQIKRYDYKNSRTNNFQNSLKNPDWLKNDFSKIKDFQIFKARGRFLFEKQILIGPRRYNKKNGFVIFTAFNKTDGSTIVVNRGFILDSDLKNLRDSGSSKTLTLGLVSREGQKKQWFIPENDVQNKKLHYINISQISELIKVKTQPFYFASIGNNFMKQENIKEIISKNHKFFNPHKKYVYFWFLMSLTLLIMIIFYRKNNV